MCTDMPKNTQNTGSPTDMSSLSDAVADAQHSIRYDTRDFTAAQIIDALQSDIKDKTRRHIVLPDREPRWSRAQRTAFIESMIVGLPSPVLVAAAQPGHPGLLQLIDGCERVLALRDYISDDLRLDGEALRFIPELAETTFRNLPAAQQRKFGSQWLRTVLLDAQMSTAARDAIREMYNAKGEGNKPNG